MEIDPILEKQAIEAARQKFPQFAGYAVKLVARPIYQGVAYMVEYEQDPPAGTPDAWEFQNAVVKTYKALAAGS